MALGCAAAVLIAHAGLLGLWSPAPGGRVVPQQALQTLQVRQIRLAAAPAGARGAGAPRSADRSRLTPGPVAVAPAPAAAPAATLRPATPAAAPPGPEDAGASATETAAPEAAPATPDVAPPAPGGDAPPVYATRLPPALTLHFDLRRGAATAPASLHWRPGTDAYALSLSTAARNGLPQAWASRGGFDGAGIAPVRYTESRRGRELRAANFQREKGRISFSGPAVEYPLLPGAQDRLSWIVQLAAVLSANPELAQAGAQVAMWVVGTQGDAEVWTFDAMGREATDTADGGPVQALRLQREPRRPYDTRVQVWVDPARHHLPVRLQLTVRASGEASEFSLRAIAAP